MLHNNTLPFLFVWLLSDFLQHVSKFIMLYCQKAVDFLQVSISTPVPYELMFFKLTFCQFCLLLCFTE